jgi:hypothetical protein
VRVRTRPRPALDHPAVPLPLQRVIHLHPFAAFLGTKGYDRIRFVLAEIHRNYVDLHGGHAQPRTRREMFDDPLANRLFGFPAAAASPDQQRGNQHRQTVAVHSHDYNLRQCGRVVKSRMKMLARSALPFLLTALSVAAEIPAGSTLMVRLNTALSSKDSKPQGAVEAVLVAPVVVGDQVALPAGVKLAGAVKAVKGVAKPEDRAQVEVEFTELCDSSGGRCKAALRIVEVDNARESVDAQGRINGILASETWAAKLDQQIEKVTQKYTRLGQFLEAAKDAFLKPPDPEIVYAPGVEMKLVLTKPLNWKARVPVPVIPPISPEDQLVAMVQAQPFCTTAEKPPKPSDITNLMFLGSAEKLTQAFAAAGWATAEQLNAISGMETVRAVAELRGYKEAPMSVLLLDGRRPDLVFQKQNNTFSRRHHLRIWRRPERFRGLEVWVCAATHDIGIQFSPENRTFIHRIDTSIDRERAKVVSDLLFTGMVKGLALVDRPAVPTTGENATGDKIDTDGKMGVLLLE